jgi:putative heme iron utilization protein
MNEAATGAPTGTKARRYLRARHAGVLSTLSARLDGHPFGSILPFVLDHAARPVILISRLAEHTRNIAADPRVSLIAHDQSDDVQAGARVTLVGEAKAVNAAELPPVQARYLACFPDAARLLALGDFSFFSIQPKTLRYIAGFGDIRWIPAADFAPPANEIAQAEASIVAHMNADHAENLKDYCRHFLRRTPIEASMVSIDCDGFDLRADGTLVRIDFPAPITNAGEARTALVAMAHAAREDLS